MNLFVSVFQIVMGSVLAVTLAGCSGFSPTGGPGSVVPLRIVSEAKDAKRLTSVNSVLINDVIIDRATLDRGTHAVMAGHPSVDGMALSRRLNQIAREELSLHVLNSQEESIKKLLVPTVAGRGGERQIQPRTSALVPISDMQPDRDEERSLAAAVKRAGGDAIFNTRVVRFIERDGSRAGTEHPAQVDLAFELVDVDGRAILWSASYHYRDQALTENLFKAADRFDASNGVGWKSAQTLFEDGVRAALRDLSERRLAQFSAQLPAGGSLSRGPDGGRIDNLSAE